jgi:predicted DNA-binding transcriptional regulator YafY
MSKLVMGARLLLALPAWPKWTTAAKVARAFDVHERTAQRHLRAFEDAGLAYTDLEPYCGTHRGRWWRA